jgi:hypothetical protein
MKMSELEVQAADPMAINLSEAEKAMLSPQQLKDWQAKIDLQVFGNAEKREMGIGSPGNRNINHFRAIRENERLGLEEPGAYAKACAQEWKDYPDNARRIGLAKA